MRLPRPRPSRLRRHKFEVPKTGNGDNLVSLDLQLALLIAGHNGPLKPQLAVPHRIAHSDCVRADHADGALSSCVPVGPSKGLQTSWLARYKVNRQNDG
jgi:hypothetical protein